MYPVDEESFQEAAPDELLNPMAQSLLVRGIQLNLSHDKSECERAGTELVEFEPDRISMNEVGRLFITQNEGVFRANNAELYKSIPQHLKRIMVLDEWCHKDFTVGPQKVMSADDIIATFESN